MTSDAVAEQWRTGGQGGLWWAVWPVRRGFPSQWGSEMQLPSGAAAGETPETAKSDGKDW